MPSQHRGRASGVARLNFALLATLLKNDEFEYTLRSPWRREDLPPELSDPRLRVIVVPRPRFMLLDVLVQLIKVPLVCARYKIDIVLNADPFGAALGARARVTTVNDLYFRTIRSELGDKVARRMSICYRVVLWGSRSAVTISNSTRADLATWSGSFGRKAVTVYPDAVGGEVKGRKLEGVPSGPYVLVVGNATPNKNLEVVADAISILAGAGIDVSIVHVGDDPNNIIARRATACEVRRFRNIGDSELRYLYENAVCLAVSSLSEGFCLPILEAQDAGCPVFCSNVSAMPEVLGDGGGVFPPKEPQILSNLIGRLISDSEYRADLVRRGYENRGRFSWQQTAKGYEALFRAI